jgi:hypothetical protein
MTDSNDTLLFEISDWIIKAMDNSLSREEFDRFQHLLKTNPLAREYYYDILATYAGVDEIKAVFIEDPALDLAMWQTLADIERTAPAIAIEKADQTLECKAKSIDIEKKARKAYKRSLFVAITSLAALFFAIAIANYNYTPAVYEEVSTLIDSLNAEWAEPDMVTYKHMRLAVDQHPWTLNKGVVKLRFDSNAQVVIEAPSRFEITSADQIRLHYGRVYAIVPPEAVGFSVKTSNSKIVDLGTEFGVQTQKDGTTELHVVKGRTTLISGIRGKISTLLTEGIAKKISGEEATLSDIQCDQSRFARDINSTSHIVWRGQSIQLADIVGKGNGLGSGKSDTGINPSTGTMESITGSDRTASNAYKAISGNPYIDGVFVPNGKTKQIVSSQGHVFEECPATCGNFYLEIANTPQLAALSPWTAQQDDNLDGNSFLLLHANLGITFDLNAIRSGLPGSKIRRFQSQLSISEVAPNTPNCDFWVLVDGKVRYSKRNVTQKDFEDLVSIELGDNDRFLTLATTDGGDPESRTRQDGLIFKSINSDWCVFADPVLILE